MSGAPVGALLAGVTLDGVEAGAALVGAGEPAALVARGLVVAALPVDAAGKREGGEGNKSETWHWVYSVVSEQEPAGRTICQTGGGAGVFDFLK